jgi:hypothetical protein
MERLTCSFHQAVEVTCFFHAFTELREVCIFCIDIVFDIKELVIVKLCNPTILYMKVIVFVSVYLCVCHANNLSVKMKDASSNFDFELRNSSFETLFFKRPNLFF